MTEQGVIPVELEHVNYTARFSLQISTKLILTLFLEKITLDVSAPL